MAKKISVYLKLILTLLAILVGIYFISQKTNVFPINDNWDWLTATPWIILVSNVTSAYGWVFDVIVVSIAVIQVASVFDFRHWTFKSGIILASFWAVSHFNTFISLPQHWFWWLASYSLVWCICADQWIIKPNQDHVLSHSSLAKHEA